MIVLSGNEVGAALDTELAADIAALTQAGTQPCLAVVMVGHNPESQSYVANKIATAQRLGMRSVDRHLPADVSQAALEAEILALNSDPTVHGVLCQLPLPAHLDAARIPPLIDPRKDVDCFHPLNFGLLSLGTPRFVPCTPAGILAMLRFYKIPVPGKHVVVMGRSNIVGRPMALLLSQKGWDATVTCVHSRSGDPGRYTRQADILVVAVGQPEWLGPEQVAEGAVVIDVGVNRVADPPRKRGYRLCGDVRYDALAPKVSAMTPVPGGVGPLTVRMLMRNTVQAARMAVDAGA